MSFREGKIGFLGPTSYSAVFSENPVSLGICDIEEVVEDAPDLEPISPERIQQGAEILALLRDIPLYEKFTQRFFDLCDGTFRVHRRAFLRNLNSYPLSDALFVATHLTSSIHMALLVMAATAQ